MAQWKPIPGETPLNDRSGLKVKSLKTRRQLNVVEAENIRKATVKYLSKKPTRRRARFDLAWCLKLHREMFGDVWTWAGRPRTSDTNVGVPWHQVESSLQSLCEDLPYWKNAERIEQAAMLHHRAVFIHPFKNGNGRWARLLANIWLRLHDAPITLWPEQTVGAQSIVRREYLAAIRAADRGDYDPLIALHRRFSAEPGDL
jgi:Fic-DOC domain mobile mystery protein B